VIWQGKPPVIPLRLCDDTAHFKLTIHLTQENGEYFTGEFQQSDLPARESIDVENRRYSLKHLILPHHLPLGYHRLTVEVGKKVVHTLIIVAPVKAYKLRADSDERIWGLFIPLYSLHSKRSWGTGDFSDMASLVEWGSSLGSRIVGTLPLLASFLDEPFSPSPYTPVSRLMWNELYLDISVIPELCKCPSAQELLASSASQEEIESLRRFSLIDYRRQIALKRRVLQQLSHYCFEVLSNRLEELQRFTKANPLVEDYARFRATVERQGRPWTSWPWRLRQGVLKEDDYDEEVKQYYLYVEWLTRQQFHHVYQKARDGKVRLYLDMPLGTHPDGYDVWRNQSLFLTDCCGGAPPDTVFTKGQNWGFPPINPEKLRQQNYDHYRACLRHHLRPGSILRIDHVMSLHRLYCIPKSLPASEGVYIRYRPEEFYAIVALESHRNMSIIVGEDLGTVPPEVRPSMKRHGIYSMYVLEYEILSNRRKSPPAVPANTIASINTHDMPPLAGFWQGLDIQDRAELGLLNKRQTRREQKELESLKEALIFYLQRNGLMQGLNPRGHQDILRAFLTFLSASSADMVLVNLEDLWLETEPQNVPGTGEERPNWLRKARFSFEEFKGMPEVIDLLKEVQQIRQQRGIKSDAKKG
jgi:4-alpha-glucanotransferase